MIEVTLNTLLFVWKCYIGILVGILEYCLVPPLLLFIICKFFLQIPQIRSIYTNVSHRVRGCYPVAGAGWRHWQFVITQWFVSSYTANTTGSCDNITNRADIILFWIMIYGLQLSLLCLFSVDCCAVNFVSDVFDLSQEMMKFCNDCQWLFIYKLNRTDLDTSLKFQVIEMCHSYESGTTPPPRWESHRDNSSTEPLP